MKRNDYNFPYPILIQGGLDYKSDCYFDVDLVNQEDNETEIVFHLKYDLKSKFLNELIDKGKAAVIVQYFSKSTCLRGYKTLNDKITRLLLKKNEVSRKIELRFFIVSTENISVFNSNEHNLDIFSGVSSKVLKGDKLAIGKLITIQLDEVDPLRPLSSIFRIKKGTKTDPLISVDCNGDKIIVLMNESLYDDYSNLRINSDIRLYLSSLIIVPALTEAISYMRNNKEDRDELRWSRRLENFISAKDRDIDNDVLGEFEIANILLNNPIGVAFTSLKKYHSLDQGDEK